MLQELVGEAQTLQLVEARQTVQELALEQNREERIGVE